MRWKQLGRDAGRAIAIGVGAGAFEAALIGAVSALAIAAWLAGAPGLEDLSEQIRKAGAKTPLVWLVAPVERVSAIICHAACRGLVLVGVTYGKRGMIALGFLIFTLLDAVAGAAQISGAMATISLWWIELPFALIALVSLPVLRWLFLHYPSLPGSDDSPMESSDTTPAVEPVV
jgi:hypothetical protein